jgi:AGCS family alanine or glycine:cation symporter
LMVLVMVRHAQEIPGLFRQIFFASFTAKSALGGIFGHTVKETIRHGVSRGLFSNEAGFGSAPNAAASADVAHPVEQGLVQMLAVYIDTLLICTATAFIILLAPSIDVSVTGIALTQAAAEYHFGILGRIFIGIAILLFGFTTILGNTFYGEANVQFLSEKPAVVLCYRVLVLVMVVFGATLSVPMVWQMAELMSALMVLINLSGVMLMATIVKKTTQHFQNRRFIKSPFSFESIGLIHTTQYNFAFDTKSK